jgi:hypothetical protein
MAVTVLDSFVLELGLDPAKLNQQQKEALAAVRKLEQEWLKSGKVIESQANKTTEAFSALKKQALGTVAVFLGGRGIKEFTEYISQLDAATGRSARTMNLSARELSNWQGVAVQTGGTAAGMTGSLAAMSQALNMVALTGQASFLPVLNRLGVSLKNQKGDLKTSTELYLDIARALQGWDPAKASALLSLLPGASPELTNALLMGEAALRRYLDAANAAGGTTAEAARQAADYQRNLALLERTATDLGRTLFNVVAPALARVAGEMATFFQGKVDPNAPPASLAGAGFGAPGKRLTLLQAIQQGRVGEWWNQPFIQPGERPPTANAAGAMLEFQKGTTGPVGPAGGDHAAFIRSTFAAEGIDPDTAIQVARSEGLGTGGVGDRGSSFGDFQLHYGGMAGGGMAGKGLGDEFTRQTGLDARDPRTWQAQAQFVAKWVKTHGWGDFHGWRGAPFAGIGAGTAASFNSNVSNRAGDNNTTSNSTHIGSITVIHSEGDARGFAGNLGSAIERQNLASSVNGGAQ